MKMITLPNDTSFLRSVFNDRRRQPAVSRKIALPTMDGYIFKRIEQIILLEAEGNYTKLQFADGSQILVCKTLRNTEALLEGAPQFIRVHRSYTINLDHLEKYIRGKGGYAVMENGHSVSVSSSRKPHFMKALGYYFGGCGEGC